jgi:copper chaperone CopZ
MRVLPRRLFVCPQVKVGASQGPEDNARTTLRVEGLLCSLCAARTRVALESLPGVWAAQVDLDAGRATIEHNRALAGTPALVKAVESAVVLRPLRRLLATVAGRWRYATHH